MDVTVETPEQTQERLARVLRAADIEWLTGEYTYDEVDSLRLAATSLEEALAIVRDGNTWSILQTATNDAQEKFCIFAAILHRKFQIAVLWVGLPQNSRSV